MAVATLAVTVPADAQYPRTARLETNGVGGVYANATVTYENEDRIYPIRLYVGDTACDSSDVYGHFIVYSNGGVWATPRRYANGGCGTSTEWNNLYIHDGTGILGVELEACVDTPGSDECEVSHVAYNPYLNAPDPNALQLMIASANAMGRSRLPGPDGVIRYVGER